MILGHHTFYSPMKFHLCKNFIQIFVQLSQCSGIHSVHIVTIDGPEVVKSGSELMLDCNFDYMEEEESQLDLKWYFNGSPIPVYQWVPSMKKGPQVNIYIYKAQCLSVSPCVTLNLIGRIYNTLCFRKVKK